MIDRPKIPHMKAVSLWEQYPLFCDYWRPYDPGSAGFPFLNYWTGPEDKKGIMRTALGIVVGMAVAGAICDNIKEIDPGMRGRG